MNYCKSLQHLFTGKSFAQTADQFLRIPAGSLSAACRTAFSTEPIAQPIENEKIPNPLLVEDMFGVRDLFTVKDLFDARVHLGHKVGSLHPTMRPFIFGSRFDHLVIDLAQTAPMLRNALNFAAHVAYRDGIILFVSNYQQHCPIVEATAIECGEYAHTRRWYRGTFTNSQSAFRATVRLPDLCILLNTLNEVLLQHWVIFESAKMCIPTIGIVDTNCNNTIVTYPVPGNDDSVPSMKLYCKLFKEAILRGKKLRQEHLALQQAEVGEKIV